MEAPTAGTVSVFKNRIMRIYNARLNFAKMYVYNFMFALIIEIKFACNHKFVGFELPELSVPINELTWARVQLVWTGIVLAIFINHSSAWLKSFILVLPVIFMILFTVFIKLCIHIFYLMLSSGESNMNITDSEIAMAFFWLIIILGMIVAQTRLYSAGLEMRKQLERTASDSLLFALMGVTYSPDYFVYLYPAW